MNKRKKREKERRNKIRENEKRAQLANRKKLFSGGNVKLTITAKMPKAQDYERVINSGIIDEKIKKLNSLDLRVVSDADVIAAVNDIIAFEPQPGVKIVNMLSNFRKIHNGNLYRVRTCESGCLETMRKDSDAWNPPPEFVSRRGRLNNVNESLLYVAENVWTAVKEMKVKEYECFWLIVYNISEGISVIEIGEPVHERNDAFSQVYNKIADLLRKEFTRDVKKDEEYEYRVSNAIAKFYYPFFEFDGWSYPSVADLGRKSLCLDPKKVRGKISLKTVLHCMINHGEIIIDKVASLDKDGQFRHETIDEETKQALQKHFNK